MDCLIAVDYVVTLLRCVTFVALVCAAFTFTIYVYVRLLHLRFVTVDLLRVCVYVTRVAHYILRLRFTLRLLYVVCYVTRCCLGVAFATLRVCLFVTLFTLQVRCTLRLLNFVDSRDTRFTLRAVALFPGHIWLRWIVAVDWLPDFAARAFGLVYASALLCVCILILLIGLALRTLDSFALQLRAVTLVTLRNTRLRAHTVAYAFTLHCRLVADFTHAHVTLPVTDAFAAPLRTQFPRTDCGLPACSCGYVTLPIHALVTRLVGYWCVYVYGLVTGYVYFSYAVTAR